MPNNKKRILIVTDAWHPQINGVVRTIEYMTKYLEQFGFEVILETPEGHFSVPTPTYKEIRLSLFNPLKLYKKLDAYNADYIHIATEGSLGMAARRWAQKRKYQYTTAFHTMLPDYIKKRFGFIPIKWLWLWEKWFHKNATYCLVPTKSVCNILINNGFTNVSIWSRGVDIDKFKPLPKQKNYPSPVWLYIGRIAIEKNLEAFLNLPLDGTKLVVGGGPALETLKKQYPNVIFLGAKKEAELVKYYNEGDVFVFPSKTDTFGLVMLEALACGKPVAAFPVAGPLDVIGNRPIGVLNNNLASACQEALTISPQECRNYAKTQSWENIIKEFCAQMVDKTGNIYKI